MNFLFNDGDADNIVDDKDDLILRLEEKNDILKKRQKEYFKNWYNKNIKDNNKRVVCECGSNVSYMNLCNHRKTKKHLRLLCK